jgi:hypothetical protein
MDSKGFRSATQQQPVSARHIRNLEEFEKGHPTNPVQWSSQFVRDAIQLISWLYNVVLSNVHLLGDKETFRFVGEDHSSFEHC